MKPAEDRAQLVQRGILTLAMAALGAIVLTFQDEPGTRGQAAAAPHVVRTVASPHHENARGERAFPSAVTPAEAAPCLIPASVEAAQRYRRFSRTPAHADARDIPVLRPGP